MRGNSGLIGRICGVLAVFMLLLVALGLPVLGGGSTALAEPGSGWEEYSPQDSQIVFDVFSVDQTVTWAAGLNDQGRMTAYRSTDGGQTWTVSLPDPTLGYSGLCRVFALDEDKAWLYGLGGDSLGGCIFRTENGGLTWEKIFSATNKFPLRLIALDENNLWVVGEEVFAWGTDLFVTGYVERSSDGGSNWVRQYTYLFLQGFFSIHDPRPLGGMTYWFDLEAVDANTAWCVIYDRLIKSENGGLSWEIKLSQEEPVETFFNVTAVSPTTAWVAMGKDVQKTSDGGTTWETQYSSGSGELIRDLAAADASVAWALLADVSFSSAGSILSNGRPVKTIDGGASWFQQAAPSTFSPVRMAAMNASTAWIAGSIGFYGGGGVILKTIDGGDPAPDIVSISPSSGEAGAQVIIAGRDYGEAQDTSRVFFGEVQATEYISWSDSEIRVGVPGGVEGEVMVTVTTPQGTSNPIAFDALETLSLSSVTPDSASQVAPVVDLRVCGSGFLPGASVRLLKGSTVLSAHGVNVVSSTEITCSAAVFGADPGTYDVVVTNPDAREARLPGAFTVEPLCGAGSGTALLMLGLTLGLLSLAGTARAKRRRRVSP